MYKFWRLDKAWCGSPMISEANSLYTMLNDPEIMQYGDNNPVSIEECRIICRGRYPWFFIRSMESELIGITALLRSDGNSAEICILLNKHWRNQGIGKQVVKRLVLVALHGMGIKRLYARVLKTNPRASAFFISCGFHPVNNMAAHLRVPNQQSSFFYEYIPKPVTATVSVIIPTCNCQAWIEDCLDSLADLPVQIIIVDDVSTDHTVAIIQKRMKKDSRLNLIRLKEKGFAGGARNEGLKYVTGDYVFFLDADDLIYDSGVWQRMMFGAIISQADIISSTKVDYFNEEKHWVIKKGSEYTGLITENLRELMFYNQKPLWMCWFRTDFIRRKGLQCLEKVRSYEDNYFSFMAAAQADSVVTIHGVLVSHRIRSESLSHCKDCSVQTEFISVAKAQYEYAVKHGIIEKYPLAMERCFYHSVFLNAEYVWKLLGYQEDWILEASMEFLRNHFPQLKENVMILDSDSKITGDFLLAWDDMPEYLRKKRQKIENI